MDLGTTMLMLSVNGNIQLPLCSDVGQSRAPEALYLHASMHGGGATAAPLEASTHVTGPCECLSAHEHAIYRFPHEAMKALQGSIPCDAATALSQAASAAAQLLLAAWAVAPASDPLLQPWLDAQPLAPVLLPVLISVPEGPDGMLLAG